jgi:DNA mismatch repair protein MutS2
MDELGTGTDPAQGAAIACAVLEELREKGAFVLATTHLVDIVAFVHRNGGMVNASMEFDKATLAPLYRLKTGEPGQSHALEIARKYGLPANTLRLAEEMMGTMKAEFHGLLEDLKAKRREHEAAIAEARRLGAELEKKRLFIAEHLAEAEKQRKELLAKAYAEARELVTETRRQVNAIIEEAKAEKAKAKEAARKLAQADAKIEKELDKLAGLPSLSIAEIREGDTVFVKTLGHDAVVSMVDIKRGRVKIRAGDKEFELPVQSLAPGQSKEYRGLAPAQKPSQKPEMEEKAVPARLHLLGLRVDEALPEVERFLNDASLAGLGEVVVVHGVGTGALRDAVRQYLKGHPLVKGFRAGRREEGGSGVTVVSL